MSFTVVGNERSKDDGYNIDNMAKSMGHSLLWYPPTTVLCTQLGLFMHKLNKELVQTVLSLRQNLVDKLIHKGLTR